MEPEKGILHYGSEQVEVPILDIPGLVAALLKISNGEPTGVALTTVLAVRVQLGTDQITLLNDELSDPILYAPNEGDNPPEGEGFCYSC